MTKTAAKTDGRPLREQALSAIDGYDEICRAIDALAEHAKALATDAETDPLAVLQAQVRRAVLAGDGVPADLGHRLVEAETAKRALDAELEMIGRKVGRSSSTGLIGELVNERQQLVRNESDPAFALLRDELDEILTAVRDVDATLGSVQTMEAAVRAGDEHAAAWRRLLVLVDNYDAVRTVQRDLTTQALGGPDNTAQAQHMLEAAGYIANMVELDPAWQARLTPTPKLHPGESPLMPTKPVPMSPDQPAEWKTLRESPWPAPKLTRGNGHWPTDDRPAYLRWLVSGKPEPWLPTPDQLRAKHQEMTTPRPADNRDDKQEKRAARAHARARRHQNAAAEMAAEERQRVARSYERRAD